MAERRMFAKIITESDAFLDMPLSTQSLYFHFGMSADDDGFINNPKKIQRMIGAADDDFKLLIAKRFVIPFASGVIVVKHWKINNYIQKDRYKETTYQEEKKLLTIKENNAYKLVYPECIQDVSKLDAQVSIGKVSLELGKGSSAPSAADPIENNYVTFFNNNIHPMTPFELQVLSEYESLGGEVIMAAIGEAVKAGVRRLNYIEAILRDWKAKGIKDMAGVEAAKRDKVDTKKSSSIKTETGLEYLKRIANGGENE
jgi:DnaD/phage-associated family protein